MIEDGTDLLFAYGTLLPRSPEEARAGGWIPDQVRGRLFDLGDYPALVDLGDPAASWVEGGVRAVGIRELEGELDVYEGVAESLYRRERTVTRGGLPVWVYVYARPLDGKARGLLTSWAGARGIWPQR